MGKKKEKKDFVRPKVFHCVLLEWKPARLQIAELQGRREERGEKSGRILQLINFWICLTTSFKIVLEFETFVRVSDIDLTHHLFQSTRKVPEIQVRVPQKSKYEYEYHQKQLKYVLEYHKYSSTSDL